MEPTVRQARLADREAVVAFAAAVWADRPDTVEYIPEVFEQWVESDGPTQCTVVAEVDGTAAGLCQGVLLTDHEAWLQGIRVDPAHRGEGLGLAMVEHLLAWARERGARVARNMVFSWNDAGLGQSLAAGFEAAASFRFANPEPGGAMPTGVDSDPAAAWRYWTASEGRTVLSGLALDRGRSWALSELTREGLVELAEREAVFAVDVEGSEAMGCRVRTTTDPTGDEPLAEYAVGTWDDRAAARALFDAISADAGELDVSGTRVLIPETPRHVAEAAAVRAEPADWPEVVLAATLD